jgi:IS30 family transposase
MKIRKRTFYSYWDKQVMWDRWQQGDSLHEIAQLFDRPHSSIQGIFAQAGGVRPRPRRRSRLALTHYEREEISRGLVAGRSMRLIATTLRRAPSTVSREIRRNGGRQDYRANRAERMAWERALRPKACKLVTHRRLAHLVAGKLKLQWSPDEISGWLRREYPSDESRQVSHETIYKTLFIQARGALKKELMAHLRQTRAMRRPRGNTLKGKKQGQIVDAVSIRERPAEAEDRAVPGHWEGDLIIGANQSQIATLVERSTRYCMLVRVARKDTETVINALIRQAHKLPRELYKSLTWDRGSEMADHQRFSLATDVKVYFCDPRSPWQRGSNEQINGLLRQYFPKGMDLSNVNQNHLNAIARRLNERPRKTLEYYSPAEKFAECVASIG